MKVLFFGVGYALECMPILKSKTPVSCKAVLNTTLKEMGTLNSQNCFWPFSPEPPTWGDAGADCLETCWLPLWKGSIVRVWGVLHKLPLPQNTLGVLRLAAHEAPFEEHSVNVPQIFTHSRDFLDCKFLAPLLHLEKQRMWPNPVGWGFPVVPLVLVWSGTISHKHFVQAMPYSILNRTSNYQMYFEKGGRSWNCNSSKCNFQTYLN